MAATNYCTSTYVLLVICFLLIKTGYSINCYQCNSSSNAFIFQCAEILSSDVDLKPEPCDNVYGAQYCVKHIGRYEAITLDCYQCKSETEWKCMDSELTKNYLTPSNCSYIYGARYCVKSIGRFGGGIGTKRFCSSVHMGNYCHDVQQPGDTLSYRTCVYTCSNDGCNPATSLVPTTSIIWIVPTFVFITWRRLFHR